jgi:hypothetical protein
MFVITGVTTGVVEVTMDVGVGVTTGVVLGARVVLAPAVPDPPSSL